MRADGEGRRRTDEFAGAGPHNRETKSSGADMGLIHIELFATLGLVAQSPGSPGRGPGGFPFGGCQAPLLDEVFGAQVSAAYEGTDALCSAGGRTTSSPPTGRTRRV